MKIQALCLSASVIALGWAGVASAQVTATPPKPQASDQVSEVVVTADRRTTNLQSTAVAATVLTQDQLTKQGVLTVDQLQFVAPSVVVNNFGQGNDFDIRGIGKGEHNSQTTTGVVTYRDGVATFPGYFQEEPFYDVANLEVLRGPQGTFSGQNATGGAVIITTQDPKIGGGYDGYALAHYGNYNDVGLQGAVNIPISDTFAARVAINTQYRDTFYNLKGLTFGDPNLKWGSGRLSLLWKPTEKLTISFKTDLDYLDNGGYFGDALTTTNAVGQVVANPTNHLFDINTNYGTYAVDQFVRSTLKADYVLDDGITLRSVSGYQTGRTGWKGDIDGTAAAAPNYIIAEAVDETIFSQEFNVISPEHQPISWVAGVYYQNNKYNFPVNSFDIAVPPGTIDEELEGVNATFNYAAFGQLNFKFDHGLELQVGLRYSYWSTRNHARYYVPEFVGFGYDFPQNETETGNNVTGKIALNWQADDRNFFYAFVATGAKPGGLNTALYFGGGGVPSPFRQEYVTDFEGGWKSKFFANHVRTQVGVYYNNFDHFQVTVPIPNNPLQSTEQNNPSTTVLYGFEASAQAVFGALSLNANLGLEHSELGTVYVEDPRVALSGACDLTSGPASATCLNLKGHPQTYAPEATFNVGAQYDYKLASGDVLTPAVNFAYVSSQWATLFDNVNAGDHLNPRYILGASLAWTHQDWTATLYGYNLADDQYVSAAASPIRLAGAPRQYGVSVLKKF